MTLVELYLKKNPQVLSMRSYDPFQVILAVQLTTVNSLPRSSEMMCVGAEYFFPMVVLISDEAQFSSPGQIRSHAIM